jgi:putative oxidoreductase
VKVKKIFNINSNTNPTDIALLIARIGITALVLTHGIPKLVMLLSGVPVQFPQMFGMSAELSLGLAIFAEVFCSLFLLIGFATRLAVVPLIIIMLVAVFVIHAADPFAVKEPALHYLLVYLVLLFTGSGKYSIDYLFKTKAVKLSHGDKEQQKQAYSIPG